MAIYVTYMEKMCIYIIFVYIRAKTVVYSGFYES